MNKPETPLHPAGQESEAMQTSSSHQVPILELDKIVRSYQQGERTVHVLNEASASIYPGEAVALVGPSGSGKSTFLHIVGLLERPDRGRILLDGEDISKAGDHKRTLLRRRDIGFIYQFHQLLPEFSAAENIMIPQYIRGTPQKKARARAQELLDQMGLGHRGHHRPAELSGGEQQRVAIARAVANAPRLLLADEPTGNLDPSTSDRVFEHLLGLVRNAGLATIMATHDMDLARAMDRILLMEDGQLKEISSSDIGH